MNKNDARALFVMGGSFVAYWIFCITTIINALVGS